MLVVTSPGFTLDDSWIHLQFARTIYEGTPFEYSPGYPSTGSTSPLWSWILSGVFYITTDTVNIVWGVFCISFAFYVGSSFLVGQLAMKYSEKELWSYASIMGFVVVPRNSWVMLSGMETPLFLFLLILSIYVLDLPEIRYDFLFGLVAGLAFLARPEGAIVAGLGLTLRPVILGAENRLSLHRIGSLALGGLIALAVAAPWLLYCMSVTSYPLPDTFYAKVHIPTESEIKAWNDWWLYFLMEMPHIQIGAVCGAFLILKNRPFPWLFAISLTIMYRLATPYASLINNARYLVPIFDLFMISAILGLAVLMEKVIGLPLKRKINPTKHRAIQCSGRTIVVCITILALVFPMTPSYMFQITFFGNAVKNINEQQVHIGIWLSENLPEDAVFVTHDAGALRFFSNLTMIDMAGLVSPDIVHGNMTPSETLEYLRNQGCEYFVFFDELFSFWGSLLHYAYIRLYTVHLDDNVISGRDTMSVFWINWTQAWY